MSLAGILPLEEMRRIQHGMSQDQVLQLIGPPRLELDARAALGPVRQLTDLGISLVIPPDLELCDRVWLYQHDQRGRVPIDRIVVSLLFFQAGSLVSMILEQRDLPYRPL